MKTVRIPILLSMFAVISGPALAASEGRVDDSHLLTYVFLAICGLIVLFQLVPVLSLVGSLFKGSAESNLGIDVEELKTATSKYH